MKMMKKTVKRILIGLVAFLLPIALIFAVVLVPRALREREKTQCARESAVAGLVVGFLRHHPDSWPSGWSDLRSTMDPQLVNADECIAVWSQCVEVDWSLSRQDVVGSSADAIPQVIRYQDADAHQRVATRTPERKREKEPNLLVWEFLNNKVKSTLELDKSHRSQ
jgi:hypothetical protein